ncbi:hypothetical protein DL770_002722 [Monosporascus sp. CRB-9-2]|nr:hypothetical protein DL770_002722 [Monosporascus sp. CRB-9-2]
MYSPISSVLQLLALALPRLISAQLTPDTVLYNNCRFCEELSTCTSNHTIVHPDGGRTYQLEGQPNLLVSGADLSCAWHLSAGVDIQPSSSDCNGQYCCIPRGPASGLWRDGDVHLRLTITLDGFLC